MAEAYIEDAVRTPGAKRKRQFAQWHPADMGGEVPNVLRVRGKRYGLQRMCEGGGIADATIVEAL